MRKYTPEVVTLWYRSPDVIMGNCTYTPTIDIWSIGCIFAEFLTGRSLFKELDSKLHLKSIFELFGTPTLESWPEMTKMPDYKKFENLFQRANIIDNSLSSSNKIYRLFNEFNPQAVDLLQQLLQYDPNKRISAQKALEHPYFAIYRNPVLLTTPTISQKKRTLTYSLSSSSSSYSSSVPTKSSFSIPAQIHLLSDHLPILPPPSVTDKKTKDSENKVETVEATTLIDSVKSVESINSPKLAEEFDSDMTSPSITLIRTASIQIKKTKKGKAGKEIKEVKEKKQKKQKDNLGVEKSNFYSPSYASTTCLNFRKQVVKLPLIESRGSLAVALTQISNRIATTTTTAINYNAIHKGKLINQRAAYPSLN